MQPINSLVISDNPNATALSGLSTNKPLAQPQYQISDEDVKKKQLIADAWKAYHGDLMPPLQKIAGQPDDNILDNRCQAIIDRGVDFLFGDTVDISPDSDAPEEVKQFLDTVWGKKEERTPMLQKLAMNGAVSGQAFLRIVPSSKPNQFRLVVVDPSTIYVKTAPQDCETPLLFCIEYSQTEKINGKDMQVWYREEIMLIDPDGNAASGMPDTDAIWQIQHWTRIGDRGVWTPAGDPISWPYPFPPLFGGQNLPYPNTYWGMPDLTPDLIGMNNAVNLVQSNINRINKIYGAPIIYASGVSEATIDIKPGRIIGLPTTDGRIVAVPIQSDLANSLQFVNTLRSDMDEQSGVPGVATGRITDLPRGNMSGIAIELLFMSLLKKTNKKRCTYGDLLIRVSKALLALARFAPTIEIALAWQNPLPHDDLASAQAAIAKKQVGVSNSTLQRELGYDPEEEAEQNAIDQENNAPAPTIPAPMNAPSGQPGQLPNQEFNGGTPNGAHE